MNIEDLNQMANDLLIARLEIEGAEIALEDMITSNPDMMELRSSIDRAKYDKELAQSRLLEAMQASRLKSWKTDQANFARSSRVSAQIDPEYKKNIERELKAGTEIEGWKLNETEYMSIKIAK